MKKILLTLITFSFISISQASVYWCPASINSNDLIARGGIVDDFWRASSMPSQVDNPIFLNVAAIYDAKIESGRCNYVNGSSKGLALEPISKKIEPVFHEGINWKWATEDKKWAYCNGTFCPFTDKSY